MNGRIFLVTGATNGIGQHTALKLAKTGATVLVHGRAPAKVDATVADIKKVTGNENIKGYIADLAHLASIRRLSDELHASYKHIDVLINNAGVFEEVRKESNDGYEMTFAVNVLAPFLLTSLIQDLLKAGTKSRIINVSSISQATFLDLDNFQIKDNYGDGHKAYEQSKICEIMFTIDMAERFHKDGITVNCLDPGTVNTRMLLKSWGPVGIPVEEADNEYHLSTDAKYENVTGEYFVGMRKTRASTVAYDKKLREKLWNHLVDITGAQYD
ncbi:retinol dehydrogenase 13-like [Lytechinus variegatus]|uniref:retinol dehydrogenase 13-like n=1 Tax=Lytechinus variegatus TaxID=7654 RepID=UPI001BB1DC6C|nr:retinol dehydrogenase 13-like [Lytechinus variegatus]